LDDIFVVWLVEWVVSKTGLLSIVMLRVEEDGNLKSKKLT